MIRRRLALLASVAMVCTWPAPTLAQEPQPSDPPAHISFVDGSAVLERDGETDPSPSSMPLLAGDRVRTQGGRVEILFADGSSLHMDANTVIDFQSDEVVRLLEGRMRLSMAGPARDLAYRVDAPSAWVQITEPGEYRVSLLRGEREPQVELAVLRGAAELVNEDGRSMLRAGERAFARAGAAPSEPYVFNSAAWDAFDRWSEARRDQRLGESAQYLPEDVRPYAATLDQYGSWRYEQVHGYVWYPRVSVGWRPYYYGRWASLRPYGWTWIAADPWGWPTHHYGRWGFSAGTWFWIPGRHWGPAYVSWAYAPGYVSWCPLGWNNRPLFSFVNINLFGGRRYDPWHAWTVLPRRHFGRSHVNVHVNVIAGARLDHRVRGAFAVGHSAPDARFAMPRATAPIRRAGRRTGGIAVPRGSAGSLGLGSQARPDGSARPDAVRGFPAPARPPRTDSALPRRTPNDRATPGAAPDRSGTSRAVPRNGRPADQPALERSQRARPQDSPEPGGAPSVRVPQDRARPPVTEAPAGIRAVPRRERGVTPQSLPSPRRSPAGPSSDRLEARPPVQPESRPSYRSTPPVYRTQPGAEPSYRRAPESRRIPQAAAPDRGPRPAPRADAPAYRSSPGRSPAPSYRAPERRAPSAAPRQGRPSGSPSAAPSRPPRGSGAPAAAPSRPRGGGQPSRGQATRRPRG